MIENQLVKFGQYLLSQERKRKFKKSPKNTNNGLSLRERLALIHDADIQNFLEEYASNPNIEYTQSKQVILV